MQVQSLPGCCGIREITSLSRDPNPQAAIISFGMQCYEKHLKGEKKNEWGDDVRIDRDNFRYALFSQASYPLSPPAVYGERFAAYILENGLGEIIETGTHINPNSKNKLKVWVWTVDHDAVKEHLATIGYKKGSQKDTAETLKSVLNFTPPPAAPMPPQPRPRDLYVAFAQERTDNGARS